MIVCVAANPSIDKLFEVDRVEIGTIHRPRAFLQVPGGKGLNCARAAHELGARVVATGILAGHAGRWIEEALTAEGVKNRFAWAEGETRASLSVADDLGRGMTEFYERGSDIGLAAWESLEVVVREIVSGAAWLTMSGSLPPGAPADGYARLTAIAIEHGARVALDARDEALAHGLSAGPTVVKVNVEEASALLEHDVATEADVVAAARNIRAVAGSDVTAIVTRGTEGAIVCGSDGHVLRAHLDERGPYPVGSGDAFLGGLVSMLERGSAWSDALCLALGAAAANAELAGAGRLDSERAATLARRAVVERVD